MLPSRWYCLRLYRESKQSARSVIDTMDDLRPETIVSCAELFFLLVFTVRRNK